MGLHLLAVLVWVMAMGAMAPATVLDPRGVQSETFANNLRLVVSSEPDAPVIAVEVIVKVGSADESKGQRGIAHLLEHVLWAGASGAQDPRLRVESIGGVMNGGTLRDFTRFYATVPSFLHPEGPTGSLDLAVEALGDVVVRGKITPAVLARERQVILEETTGRQEDPQSILNDMAFELMYGPSSGYGSPIGGNPADLEKLDVASLALFRETWYVPNNMAVVIAGKVSFEEARAAVLRVFGGMAPSPLPDRYSEAGSREQPVSPVEHRIPDPTVSRAYVMAAFVGPEASEHTQVCAADLLATLLTHDPIGRLVTGLRETGMADDVGVDFLTQRQRSLFGVWAVCEPGKIEEVKSAIRSELVRLGREPVPVGELSTAKRLLAAGYAFANETPSDRANTLAFYEAIDSYRAASYYLSWAADTTAQTLMTMAAQYAGEPTWVILVPAGAER